MAAAQVLAWSTTIKRGRCDAARGTGKGGLRESRATTFVAEANDRVRMSQSEETS